METCTSAVKCFKKDFPNLCESTVRRFKSKYKQTLKENGSLQEVSELPRKVLGRPLMLAELDGKVQQYIRAVRVGGIPITARLVMAGAEGIVRATDRTMLRENGGHIQLTEAWAYSILKRMNFVLRKASTKTKTSLTQAQVEVAKETFLKHIKKAVEDGKVPPELVINFDQTGVNIVPGAQWTLTEKGSTHVEIAGLGDKRQITVTVAGTLSGNLLPFQILYEGKTERCHPPVDFPEGFDVWHTPNHWANSETCIRFISNVILPYVQATRKELGLTEEHMALLIFDSFKGHLGKEMKSLLLKNNLLSVTVPSNCTDLLQPLDLSVNKPLKDHLKRKFQSWYAEEVSKQLTAGKTTDEVLVDTRLSVMKPIGARWLMSTYDYLCSNSSIITGGFAKAGIVQVLEQRAGDSDEDPFKDL